MALVQNREDEAEEEQGREEPASFNQKQLTFSAEPALAGTPEGEGLRLSLAFGGGIVKAQPPQCPCEMVNFMTGPLCRAFIE